jgi:hypothetical protein
VKGGAASGSNHLVSLSSDRTESLGVEEIGAIDTCGRSNVGTLPVSSIPKSQSFRFEGHWAGNDSFHRPNPNPPFPSLGVVTLATSLYLYLVFNLILMQYTDQGTRCQRRAWFPHPVSGMHLLRASGAQGGF